MTAVSEVWCGNRQQQTQQPFLILYSTPGPVQVPLTLEIISYRTYVHTTTVGHIQLIFNITVLMY
jgi:hypothetical protein